MTDMNTTLAKAQLEVYRRELMAEVARGVLRVVDNLDYEELRDYIREAIAEQVRSKS